MIEYRPGGRKYVLTREYIHPRSIPRFGKVQAMGSGWKLIYGTLTAFLGYSWDGPSGPTRDDKTNMRASLVHDILYSAVRRIIDDRKLGRKQWEWLRKGADLEFRRILKEDGMSWWRRAYYYAAVRMFGENAMLGKYRSKAREALRKVCAPGICNVRH